MFIYEKTCLGVSDQFLPTSACSAIEDDKQLYISDLESRGVFFLMLRKHTCRHWAELHFWFRLCKKACSYDAIQIAKTRFR